MGQQDILDILRANKDKWFSTKDLAKLLSQNTTSVNVAAKRLRDSNMIEWKYSPYDPINGAMYYRYLMRYKA